MLDKQILIGIVTVKAMQKYLTIVYTRTEKEEEFGSLCALLGLSPPKPSSL